MNVVGGLVRAARPRQWVKNVLVAAAPLAAGTAVRDLDGILVAFVTFCLMSSAVYLLNDVLDRDRDRAHPVKRLRPVASGLVPVAVASVTSLVLASAALLLARWFAAPALLVVLVLYAAVQVAYCLWLKHVAVLDLAVVSAGFVLRAVAGGAAAAVVISPWFLLVAGFASLFVAAGKRYSEVRLVGDGAATTRSTLGVYSGSYLRFVWGVACSATVVFYSLWAFGLERLHPLLAQLSVVPFLLAVLRYAVDVDRGDAGEPETIVLRDRTLQVLGVAWLAMVTVSAVQG